MKQAFLWVFAYLSVAMFFAGVMWADIESHKDKDFNCKPQSYIGLINIPYRLGCEMGIRRSSEELDIFKTKEKSE